MFTNIKVKLKFITAFLAITGLLGLMWVVWFMKYIVLAAAILFITYKVVIICIKIRDRYLALKAKIKAKFTRGKK